MLFICFNDFKCPGSNSLKDIPPCRWSETRKTVKITKRWITGFSSFSVNIISQITSYPEYDWKQSYLRVKHTWKAPCFCPADVFFSLSLALMVASLLETVFITYIQFTSSQYSAVPRWLSVLVLKYLAVVVCLPQKKKSNKITVFLNPSMRGTSLLLFYWHENFDQII